MRDPRGHAAAALRRRLPRQPLGRAARRARPAARPRRARRLRRPDSARGVRLDVDFLRGNEAESGDPGRRVPAVPHLLRQDDRAARLHRDGLPLPLQLRGPAHRRPATWAACRRCSASRSTSTCSRWPSATGGFGGVKMTGEPLPQCQFTVEPSYEGEGPAFACVNPRFFDCTDARPRGHPRLRPARGAQLAGRANASCGACGPRYRACAACGRARRRRGLARRRAPVSISVGRSSKRGSERNTAQAALAELALAEVRVTVALADPAASSSRSGGGSAGARARPWRRTRRRPRRAPRRCGSRSRRRAGGSESRQTPMRLSPSSSSTSSASSSKLRPSVPSVPAVFSSSSGQRSVVVERLRDSLRGALHRWRVRLALARSRVHDDAVGADPVADPQRVRERGERLGSDLALVGGAVDQVDGMDDDRLDRRSSTAARNSAKSSAV